MTREGAVQWVAHMDTLCPWCGSTECWSDSVCLTTGKRTPLDYEADYPEFLVAAVLHIAEDPHKHTLLDLVTADNSRGHDA